VHGQQEQQAQHEDGPDDQLWARARMLMVNVLSRCATSRAPTFYYRPSALRADQVLAAHGTPSALARATALAVM
jgi:hypothetical protein